MVWKPDYVSIESLKAQLAIAEEDTKEDEKLALAITASSRAVDHYCERQFGNNPTNVIRYYPVQTSITGLFGKRIRQSYVEIDDLFDISGLVVGDLALEDFYMWPRNAAADGQPYTHIVFVNNPSFSDADDIAVSAKWGWYEVPAQVQQAVLLQSTRLFMRKDAPFGVVGSPEMGGELRLLSSLDPDVRVMLHGLYRWWGAA